MNDWNALRVHYARFTPLILAEARNEWAIDPYAWDEGKGMMFMTPIERWLWSDIRDANAVFYPQYPVGRVFVDFANPKAKVVIECDGAAFHTDKAKDAARDAVLAADGWTVYRAPGWLCATEYDRDTGAPSEAGAFVRAIVERHGLARCGSDGWAQIAESVGVARAAKGGDL
ncbi:hypothetical protein J2W28_001022 [Variovorax boronicumulans]|uniref:endonuclease domain-containing protein n=1 Tax=Variovorax boronicumulans TaxID=436515 RepID=UPI0027822A1F|nr:DUF559 domain-containing protein [Variovorax boronicumulans]MDP9991994.1 hypothetical protein [Variovorax boronicumulans]MDQ0001889.1 hypothetical protein [Variovorax boronicumulans]